MKNILTKLSEGHFLDLEEASSIMTFIGENKINPEVVNAFVSLFLTRELTIDELSGFKNALMEMAIDPKLYTTNAIDVCGTGGDCKNTFNISTLTAFVIAGAGLPVIKHGNHGVSSFCGSSDILSYFGIKMSSDSGVLNRSLEENNLCFLHAPLFHPALKTVAPFRKSIGIKTLFNQLGPLINPANPMHRLNGTYNLSLQKQYSAIYTKEKKAFAIVHSLDGYDEISLTDDAILRTQKGESYIELEYFKLNYIKATAITGGDSIEESARIFTDVLENNSTPEQKNTVLANAALGIKCFENCSIEEAMDKARQSLESKKSLTIFKNMIS